jgi:hypothetical protein
VIPDSQVPKPQLDSRAIHHRLTTSLTAPTLEIHPAALSPLTTHHSRKPYSARPRQPRPKCSASTPAPSNLHKAAPTSRSSNRSNRKPNNNSKAKANRNNSCPRGSRAQAPTRTRRASRRYTASRRISWRLRYVRNKSWKEEERKHASSRLLFEAQIVVGENKYWQPWSGLVLPRRIRSSNTQKDQQAQSTKNTSLTSLSAPTGNRPPNPPTHRLALLALHNLPDPPLDQHPGLQTTPLRSAAALLGL